MVIDPMSTYLRLSSDGKSLPIKGGSAFWSLPRSELNAIGHDWLVSEFVYTQDWPTWEMHPAGDEVVYLLEGHISLLLELPSGVRAVELEGKGAVVVPQGVWHTARVRLPSRALHITLGKGTETKPAE